MYNGNFCYFFSYTFMQLYGTCFCLLMSCLKVGDPKQLPATVMSGLASKFLYECSMFERLQRAGYPVIMLTKQVIFRDMLRDFYSIDFLCVNFAVWK